MNAEGTAGGEGRQGRAARVWTVANALSFSRLPLAVAFAWVEDANVRFAILAAAAATMLALSRALGLLEVLGVLVRDILTPFGYLASVVVRRPFTTPARAGGKAVTVGQSLTLCAWLLDSSLLRPLAWATAAMALYALWDYGRLAVRQADRAHG